MNSDVSRAGTAEPDVGNIAVNIQCFETASAGNIDFLATDHTVTNTDMSRTGDSDSQVSGINAAQHDITGATDIDIYLLSSQVTHTEITGTADPDSKTIRTDIRRIHTSG